MKKRVAMRRVFVLGTSLLSELHHSALDPEKLTSIDYINHSFPVGMAKRKHNKKYEDKSRGIYSPSEQAMGWPSCMSPFSLDKYVVTTPFL